MEGVAPRGTVVHSWPVAVQGMKRQLDVSLPLPLSVNRGIVGASAVA